MHEIIIDDVRINVIRKKIKHIYLKIFSSTGKIRITAPLFVTEGALQDFILSRLHWIKKYVGKCIPTARYRYLSGEMHDFMGEKYELQVTHAAMRSKVIFQPPVIQLFIRDDSSESQREAVLDHWYRKQLRVVVEQFIAKWQPVIGVNVAEAGIRKMRTKWGSCHTLKRRIWLSLELAKKPPFCIEYVVVHELVHLLERRHNKRFYSLMDRFLPDWRRGKGLLASPQ